MRVPTGIPEIDEILGGGIVEGSLVELVGGCGTGKTTFSFQFAFTAARLGEKTLYVTTGEPIDKMIKYMKGFSFFDEKYIGDKIILQESFFRKTTEGTYASMLEIFFDNLTSKVEQEKISRVVIDSVTPIILFLEESYSREMLSRLGTSLSTIGCTTIFTSEAIEQVNYLEYLVDGVIELREFPLRDQIHNIYALKIKKMRGVDHPRDLIPYEITEDGIRIDPAGLFELVGEIID
ncbi:MAG: RAD55 family ATPase [Candidatus Hydrothermarchaeota archaeon]